MTPNLVSTIIPVYNRPQRLREAVASVLALGWQPVGLSRPHLRDHPIRSALSASWVRRWSNSPFYGTQVGKEEV